MNYRHVYHAGSFTDVVKHVILVALIKALQKKEGGFCVIDTHGGRGAYDLFSEQAAKTKEYENGIERVIQEENPPELIKKYLDCVHNLNNKLSNSTFASLQYYPGSPLITRALLRPQDRLIACELQREEYEALRTTFAGDKQVAIHHMDGYLSLKAHLPPHEKRGLILIDPPYENPDEFIHIVKTLPTALKRFASGVYAIWYPIKETAQVRQFHRNLLEAIEQPMLLCEFTIFPDLPHHLNGCGMAIINPPWQLQEIIQPSLHWLWNVLSLEKQGTYQVTNLSTG